MCLFQNYHVASKIGKSIHFCIVVDGGTSPINIYPPKFTSSLQSTIDNTSNRLYKPVGTLTTRLHHKRSGAIYFSCGNNIWVSSFDSLVLVEVTLCCPHGKDPEALTVVL